MQEKKLVRSVNNKRVCGVCAGIADYFGIDPTLVRLIWFLLVFAYGTGLLAYFLIALFLPKGTTNN